MVDRSSGAGQSLITGNGGNITLYHDLVNNDGTIGADTNTDTVVSAVFSPSRHRFFIEGVEDMLLDADGLAVGGFDVLTTDSIDTETDLKLTGRVACGIGRR